MSFLELKTLSKRYGDVTAVAECNLSIKEGEFVCLLGPSGCGKTTTLQMVAGFVEPTAGSILLNGQDITGLKPSKRGLGIVFQSYALFPHMTVAENVSFGLEMRKIDSAERTRRVKEAIDMVHLGPMANRYPKELSGGQRQRVAMARALVIRPPVLLLDEPMGALDAKLRDEMQIELRALQKSLGITTIMVTHDQAEAMTLADTVVLMNKGAIEQVGSPLEIYERPEDRFASTFLGRANVFQAQSDDGVTVQAKGIPFPVLARHRSVRWNTWCAPRRSLSAIHPLRRFRAASNCGYSWATTGCMKLPPRWVRCRSPRLTWRPHRSRKVTPWGCCGWQSTRASCHVVRRADDVPQEITAVLVDLAGRVDCAGIGGLAAGDHLVAELVSLPGQRRDRSPHDD